MEYYDAMGWTDGLPVVPVTESYLAGFLAQTSRAPDEVVFAMPHLNRRCTVRLAAITGTIARTGALIHETVSALIVLSPEHAHLFARAGWGKAELSRFVCDHAVHTRAGLAAVGKDAVSSKTRWRLPAGHPEAMPDQAQAEGHPDAVPGINSPGAVLVVVAGANHAGVSAVVETFGPGGGPPAVLRMPVEGT